VLWELVPCVTLGEFWSPVLGVELGCDPLWSGEALLDPDVELDPDPLVCAIRMVTPKQSNATNNNFRIVSPPSRAWMGVTVEVRMRARKGGDV
jgi:hypothetical protein